MFLLVAWLLRNSPHPPTDHGRKRAELVLPREMNNYVKIDELEERIHLTGEYAALIDVFAGVPLDKDEVERVELLSLD